MEDRTKLRSKEWAKGGLGTLCDWVLGKCGLVVWCVGTVNSCNKPVMVR
jgi:hypothetical protein